MVTSKYATPGANTDDTDLLSPTDTSLTGMAKAAVDSMQGSKDGGSEPSTLGVESGISIGQGLTTLGNVAMMGFGLMTGNPIAAAKGAYSVVSVDPMAPSKMTQTIDDALFSAFGIMTPQTKAINAVLDEAVVAELAPENIANIAAALFGDTAVVSPSTVDAALASPDNTVGDVGAISAADLGAISEALGFGTSDSTDSSIGGPSDADNNGNGTASNAEGATDSSSSADSSSSDGDSDGGGW